MTLPQELKIKLLPHSRKDLYNDKKLIRLFLILVAILMLPSASGALAKDAQVTALRWTSRNDGNPPFVRIAMDLSKAVHAEAAIDDAGKNFEVVLKKTSMGSVASQYDMDPRAIDFATLSEKDGDTYLDVALSKPQKIDDIRVFALRPDAKMKKPHRLVVDIPVIGAKQTYTKRLPLLPLPALLPLIKSRVIMCLPMPKAC